MIFLETFFSPSLNNSDCRVVLGTEKHAIPWIGSFKSSIDDWSLRKNDHQEEFLTDIITKFSDDRLTVLIQAESCKGKTSLLHQLCLDWGRGASYLEHFNLVILLDCSNIDDDQADLDKVISKTYKVVKQEKLNLQKWEVQQESFLLVLDNFNKLNGESLEVIKKVIVGETYSKCSVIAASKNSCHGDMFKHDLMLEGWREEVVLEVIHRQFTYSPNKVLALKLKLSNNEPYKHLLQVIVL